MEIRLAKLLDKFPEGEIKIEFFDHLSEKQFENFEKAISEIEEIHYIRRLLDFVALNDIEIINYLNDSLHNLIQKSVSWNGVKRDDGDKVFQNVNRLFLNYLSSIRTFLDHSETFLKRKYGENSNEFKEFKKIISYFFDNSFAYRFFYKLRNYSQHIGLPIDNFNFTTEYDNEESLIKGKLSISFNGKKLLSNYNSWGIVKNDLENMQEQFDVTPLLFEMTHNIRDVERNIELISKNELLKASKFITDLTKHLKDNESEIFVAHNFRNKENGELASYDSINIPFETIDFIIKEL